MFNPKSNARANAPEVERDLKKRPQSWGDTEAVVGGACVCLATRTNNSRHCHVFPIKVQGRAAAHQ
jgi:hypothetical protein